MLLLMPKLYNMGKYSKLDAGYVQRLNRMQKLYRTFPNAAGIEAVNFSKKRFIRKNWVDKTTEPWKKRKKKAPGSLMVGKGSGRLKRSIRKIKVTRNSVTIGTDVPYAQIHNEGGTIKATANVRAHTRTRKGRKSRVRKHTRKMNTKIPQRQFIGESALLMHRIERLMQVEMMRALK